MNRRGNRLRAFAAGWCCPETMERVIDPLIADLQREYSDAVRQGRIWKSRWIQIAGWVTFFKVLIVCGGTTLTAVEQWTPDDRKSLTRAAVISAMTAVVITVLLVSRSAEDYPKVLLHPSPKRLLFLAPFPFVAGVVLGSTLGIVLGLGGRALSRRLVVAAIGFALICSAIVFVDVGWVAPAAHIAYRMTVGDTDPSPALGEQSLGELHRQLQQFSRDATFAHFGLLAALLFDFHRRVALSFSPLVFTLFGLTMAGCSRRRWVLGIGACVALFVYAWLVIRVTPWGMQWPVYAAAWCANGLMLVASALLLGLRTRHSTPLRTPS
jgi:hypothetical protein